MNIKDIKSFYSTPLGELVHLYVQDVINSFLNVEQNTILTLGFPIPYLKEKWFKTNQFLIFMPASLGGMTWPTPEKSRTAVVNELSLPLPNQSVDLLLVIHSLEFTSNPKAFMKEVDRILKIDGKVLLIVPNKRGVWGHLENTPFGYGQSFSMQQMTRLLSDQNFKTVKQERFLYFPPSQSLYTQSFFAPMEMIGSYLAPNLSGLNAILAEKRAYAPITKQVSAPVKVKVQLKSAFQNTRS